MFKNKKIDNDCNMEKRFYFYFNKEIMILYLNEDNLAEQKTVNWLFFLNLSTFKTVSPVVAPCGTGTERSRIILVEPESYREASSAPDL
jgi:hypothetical protein